MPLLVLTLTPALRRQVDAAQFCNDFAEAAARVAGRQKKWVAERRASVAACRMTDGHCRFIFIKLAEGELSFGGQLAERAWLLEFVAAEIVTEVSLMCARDVDTLS
jgi:hypothetical protein